MALTIGDLRNDTVSVCLLPKLDVAGSSPVARSQENSFCELEALGDQLSQAPRSFGSREFARIG
jgi:hypothetical protein